MASKIERTSSGTLTAYIAVMVAVLGSFIRFVRMGYEHFAFTLASGIGAGVVCYLAAYGGLISTDVTDSTITSNPYNSALISFLCGLFSVAFFDTLRQVVEQSLAKIPRKIFGDPPTNEFKSTTGDNNLDAKNEAGPKPTSRPGNSPVIEPD